MLCARFLFALFSKTGSGKIESAGRLQGWRGLRERCERARPGLALGPGCPSASLLLSTAQFDRSTRHSCPNRCEGSTPYASHSRRSAAAEQHTKMTSWAQVSKCWKVDNGDDFDAKALELYFPASKDHEGAEARKAIWKSMDNNNNKYVSLAEYDGWFNQSGSRRPVV